VSNDQTGARCRILLAAHEPALAELARCVESCLPTGLEEEADIWVPPLYDLAEHRAFLEHLASQPDRYLLTLMLQRAELIDETLAYVQGHADLSAVPTVAGYLQGLAALSETGYGQMA